MSDVKVKFKKAIKQAKCKHPHGFGKDCKCKNWPKCKHKTRCKICKMPWSTFVVNYHKKMR